MCRFEAALKILMISDVYFPRINGVSTSIQTFRNELTALGHEVVLVAPDYGAIQSDEQDVMRVPSRYLVLDPEDRMMRAQRVRELAPALRERRFDLIHIQTPFVAHYAGMAIADQLGLPRVETYHTFFEEYLFHYVPFLPRGWMRALARRFSRTQCNSLDAVVVPSFPMQAVLREYGVTVPLEVIPTGLELQRVAGGDGQAFRRQHGIAPDRPTLVHVGRVAFEKNIDFLLRMLVRVREHVRDVLLVICGEGPALMHLRRLALRLGVTDNVLFVGYLDRTKGLLDCYCAGDAFVFASRTETQGLVLLEAMALGVPVVSTAVMGTRDILGPQRGALVVREDEAEFATKAVQVLRDADLRQRLSDEARTYAREWSAQVMTARMLAFYRRVVGQGTAGRRTIQPRAQERAVQV
jgi:1,2-diacylglycerol 3-alpha-glucosyltransferase